MAGRKFFVEILAKTETSDNQGGNTITWNVVGSAWAEINPLKGYQKLNYEKIDSKIDHKIILRAPVIVKDGNQIRARGRIFEVKGPPVNLDERDRYVEVLAREVFG